MILHVFIAMVAGWLQRDQQQVITYLQAENHILKAQLGGHRLRLTDTERRRLAALAHPLGRTRLKEVAFMSDRLFEDDVTFLQRLLKSGGLYTDTIDGIWGENTDSAVNAFETRSAQIAAALGTFDTRTERNIQTVHLRVQEAARAFMNAIRAAGINARIISGTRTYAEQNALYRKGRFGNPPPRVTNARGGQSNHNFGIAWDIGIFTQNGAYLPESPLYNQAAKVGLAAGIIGLEWGGNWTSFIDRPHYQLATGLSISEVRRRFESGQPYI